MTNKEAVELLKTIPIPRGCDDNVHSTPYSYEYAEALDMTIKVLSLIPDNATTDLVERSELFEYEKRIRELEERNDDLNYTLTQAMKKVRELTELRAKLNKAIEEITDSSFIQYTELGDYIGENRVKQQLVMLNKVLEIFKRELDLS